MSAMPGSSRLRKTSTWVISELAEMAAPRCVMATKSGP